jgi:uncharacterized protein HemY
MCELQNAIRITQYAIRGLFQQFRQRADLQGLRVKFSRQDQAHEKSFSMSGQPETNTRVGGKYA